MPFLRSSLKPGAHYVFRGQLAKKKGSFALEQPQMYTMAAYAQLQGSMQPIYPLTKGLSNKTVAKAVKQALEKYDTCLEKEYIPVDIRSAYQLAEHNFAVQRIHFPQSQEDYLQSRKRLAFEEFFLFVLAVRNMKEKNTHRLNEYRILNDARTDKFISELEFELTDAQKKTWEEIKENMSGSALMSRLIQGDVGSGKTIIAVLALMNTAFAGYQGAMMVPKLRFCFLPWLRFIGSGRSEAVRASDLSAASAALLTVRASRLRTRRTCQGLPWRSACPAWRGRSAAGSSWSRCCR